MGERWGGEAAATSGLAPPSLLVGGLLTDKDGLAPRTLAELLLRVGVAAGELQGVGGTHLDGRGWWCFVVEMEGDGGRWRWDGESMGGKLDGESMGGKVVENRREGRCIRSWRRTEIGEPVEVQSVRSRRLGKLARKEATTKYGLVSEEVVDWWKFMGSLWEMESSRRKVQARNIGTLEGTPQTHERKQIPRRN